MVYPTKDYQTFYIFKVWHENMEIPLCGIAHLFLEQSCLSFVPGVVKSHQGESSVEYNWTLYFTLVSCNVCFIPFLYLDCVETKAEAVKCSRKSNK